MFRRAQSPEITHDYVEDRLSAYIDGQLPDMERVQVRKHLQACSQCQASLDSLGWTVRLLKQVPTPPLPRQFTLPVPEPKGAPASWLRWGIAAASATAAVAFLALITVDFLSQGQLAPQAAAPIPRTLVAVAAPTNAPAGLDRALSATSAPIQEQATVANQATTGELPTVVEPSARPPAPQVQIQSEAATPTEALPPLSAKSALPSPSCETCGAGLGGGAPDETPETMTIAVAAPITTTGAVNARTVAVNDAPSDKAKRIGNLTRGLEVEVLARDETGNWLQIVFPLANVEGLTGWVEAKSITLPIPEDRLRMPEVPTVTPTPTPEMSTTPTESPTPTLTETPPPTPTPLTLAAPSETPTLQPGMTINSNVTISASRAMSREVRPNATPPAASTKSPNETSPPAVGPTIYVTSPSVSPANLSPDQAPLRTPLVLTTASPPPHAHESQSVTVVSPAFRLAEIAALVLSVALGAAAFVSTRS
jgi:anti-sigma factor RsiW